jgi:hypothetical protein
LAGQFDDTRGSSIQQERHCALLALDWLVRTYTVAWLRLVPALVVHAERLASLPPLTEPGSGVEASAEVVYDARDAAFDMPAHDVPKAVDTSWADWSAEREAVWSSVKETVWTAVRVTAGEAASHAAREGAGEAVANGSLEAANGSLEAAYLAVVYVAKAAAARLAAEPAAARMAAEAALQPTVEQLQASAWALLDRLCAPGEQVAPQVESLEADAGEDRSRRRKT